MMFIEQNHLLPNSQTCIIHFLLKSLLHRAPLPWATVNIKIVQNANTSLKEQAHLPNLLTVLTQSRNWLQQLCKSDQEEAQHRATPFSLKEI